MSLPPLADPAAGDTGNNKALSACPASGTYTAPTAYAYRTPVVGYFPTASGTTVAGSRNFTLPFAGLGAECSDSLQVGFLQPLPEGGNKVRHRSRHSINTWGAAAVVRPPKPDPANTALHSPRTRSANHGP